MCEVPDWDVRMLQSMPCSSTVSTAIVHNIFCLEFVEDPSQEQCGVIYELECRPRVQGLRLGAFLEVVVESLATAG